MSKKSSIIIPVFISIIVICASYVSTSLWMEKKEEVTATHEIIIKKDMTVNEISQSNTIPIKVIQQALNKQKLDVSKTLGELGVTFEKGKKEIIKGFAIYQEHSTKNWFKIPLKFILWFIFMGIVFYNLKKQLMTPKSRKLFYALAVVIFGVILGADPSPMGTVKDAIALYGEKRAIFPPRMVAFVVFLLTVFLANKMICSWGCQLGTLQDLIFRFNRNKKDTKGVIPQIKIPFIVSNTIRIIFFMVFTAICLIWATDIVAEIDPFKTFKPQFLTVIAASFVAVLLISSIFIYRPWCLLFCPFGLTGWLVEKISFYKIRVDYDKCVSCMACEKACPSDVMGAILKRDRVIPDCFSCGSCIESCPEKAINFSKGKRDKPAPDKFKK